MQPKGFCPKHVRTQNYSAQNPPMPPYSLGMKVVLRAYKVLYLTPTAPEPINVLHSIFPNPMVLATPWTLEHTWHTSDSRFVNYLFSWPRKPFPQLSPSLLSTSPLKLCLNMFFVVDSTVTLVLNVPPSLYCLLCIFPST